MSKLIIYLYYLIILLYFISIKVFEIFGWWCEFSGAVSSFPTSQTMPLVYQTISFLFEIFGWCCESFKAALSFPISHYATGVLDDIILKYNSPVDPACCFVGRPLYKLKRVGYLPYWGLIRSSKARYTVSSTLHYCRALLVVNLLWTSKNLH